MNDYMDGVGIAVNMLGRIEYHKGDLMSSLKYYNEAGKIFEQCKNAMYRYDIYNNIGTI